MPLKPCVADNEKIKSTCECGIETKTTCKKNKYCYDVLDKDGKSTQKCSADRNILFFFFYDKYLYSFTYNQEIQYRSKLIFLLHIYVHGRKVIKKMFKSIIVLFHAEKINVCFSYVSNPCVALSLTILWIWGRVTFWAKGFNFCHQKMIPRL